MTTCVLCRDAFAEGAEKVTDAKGRDWHRGCAALAFAHRTITQKEDR